MELMVKGKIMYFLDFCSLFILIKRMRSVSFWGFYGFKTMDANLVQFKNQNSFRNSLNIRKFGENIFCKIMKLKMCGEILLNSIFTTR